MKRRFSSHIMPQRMARQFLWALAEAFFLYIVFKITAVKGVAIRKHEKTQ